MTTLFLQSIDITRRNLMLITLRAERVNPALNNLTWYVSFEWSHLSISSTHSKAKTSLYNETNSTTGKYSSAVFVWMVLNKTVSKGSEGIGRAAGVAWARRVLTFFSFALLSEPRSLVKDFLFTSLDLILTFLSGWGRICSVNICKHISGAVTVSVSDRVQFRSYVSKFSLI